MDLVRKQLNQKYQAILKTFKENSFNDFYDSVFNYCNFIEKQPDMNKIIEYDRNDIFEKKQQVSADFKKWEKRAIVEKIESYSSSFPYDKILQQIYIPMKEYRELLTPIKTKEHARGCALSKKEFHISFLEYLIDFILHSIFRNDTERYYAYFRLKYKIQMLGYKEIVDKIHPILINKFIELEVMPKKDIFIRTEPEFDYDTSILTINGKKIKITLKNDKPDGHYVLEYLFDHGIKNKAYYSDILEEKFLNEEKDNNSMYRACNDVNDKVFKQANFKDFLEVHSGKTGWTKVEKAYA